MSDDVLSQFEAAIAEAEAEDAEQAEGDETASPWTREPNNQFRYVPNSDLLIRLLSGPMSDGAKTQSGRLAKAFDAWMSYELRRAGMHPNEVWPRNATPRVSSRDIEQLTDKVNRLTAWVEKRDADHDAVVQAAELEGNPEAVRGAEVRLQKETARLRRAYDKRVATHAAKTLKAEAEGKEPPAPLPALNLPERIPVTDPLPHDLRNAIQGVVKAMPNNNATNILGRFYVKQVDVVVASRERGPDILISGKTMFSSFAKNTKNRYEETLGEASNLRDRYPLTGMGYAFLVSDDIFTESGAYARLQDLLLRTRKPYGPYDATMLLIATWDDTQKQLTLSDPTTHPNPDVSGQDPPVDLSAATFFTNLLDTVILNTPVGVHDKVRLLRNGTAIPGGAPDLEAAANADADAELTDDNNNGDE